MADSATWQQQLAESRIDSTRLAGRFGLDPGLFREVAQRFPVAITPYYLRLVENPADPIGRQCLPDARELAEDENLLLDPLGEQRHTPVEGVIHRYRDRVVFLVASECAVYCRFCTRKQRVGCPALQASVADQARGLAYIGAHPEISDVLLSGGDPLLLEDEALETLLQALRAIPHIETVRIGTRVPVTLPQRVTPALAALLGRFAPLYLNTHFNHPRELTHEAAEACRRLAEAGVVLGNQTVLLRDVNDHATTLRELFKGLLRLRVRPYYLHHMDLVQGAAHFRTRIEDGLALMRALRGPVSGMALPHYMLDLPDGQGKVPLTPDYLKRLGPDALIEAPGGTLMSYPNDTQALKRG